MPRPKATDRPRRPPSRASRRGAMTLLRHPAFALILGAVVVAMLALIGARASGPALADRLSVQAQQAIARVGGEPVVARFRSPDGAPTRHPLLSGGERLDTGRRARVARAVAAVPGVGGIRWADGRALAAAGDAPIPSARHCEDDVGALLLARTIRFEESSARIDAASRELLDEVAAALRPCLGSIIAIIGHTDSSGSEPGNLALSLARAEAVRDALVARGIPDDGLRVSGRGSRDPIAGLDPTDPANRRIEFAVVALEPIAPTPVDRPGPR